MDIPPVPHVDHPTQAKRNEHIRVNNALVRQRIALRESGDEHGAWRVENEVPTIAAAGELLGALG